ncbi:MAG: hypothetical protein V4534_05795 [Myxococcota bacterium]
MPSPVNNSFHALNVNAAINVEAGGSAEVVNDNAAVRADIVSTPIVLDAGVGATIGNPGPSRHGGGGSVVVGGGYSNDTYDAGPDWNGYTRERNRYYGEDRGPRDGYRYHSRPSGGYYQVSTSGFCCC